MDLNQTGHPSLESGRYPLSNTFERRHLQPVDVVKISVIELLFDPSQRPFEIRKIEDEARLGIGFALKSDAHMKRMPMDPRVGMLLRCSRQTMSGLEAELFVNSHHGVRRAQRSPINLCV